MADNVSRRDFVKTTGAAATAAAALSTFAAPAPARAVGAKRQDSHRLHRPRRPWFRRSRQVARSAARRRANVELVAVSEVYSKQRDMVCSFIKEKTGTDPKKYDDYNDMLADANVDRGLHRHARPLAPQANRRLAPRGQARLRRKADDEEGRRSLGRREGVEGDGQGDAGRRAVD